MNISILDLSLVCRRGMACLAGKRALIFKRFDQNVYKIKLSNTK